MIVPMLIAWDMVQSSLGPVLVAASPVGICRLAFRENEADLARHFPNAVLERRGRAGGLVLEQALAAVEGQGDGAQVPLDLRGTPFQQRIWQALRAIPPGETRSYAQLAAAAGHPRAVRAAGQANGANPVAVLVPCHRVVRADGQLGGYAYGPAIKRALLEREGAC